MHGETKDAEYFFYGRVAGGGTPDRGHGAQAAHGRGACAGLQFQRGGGGAGSRERAGCQRQMEQALKAAQQNQQRELDKQSE